MIFTFDNIRYKLNRIWLALFTGVLVTSSCGIKKHLQPGQVILDQSTLEIEKPYKKETYRAMNGLYKQRPNKKLLFIFKTRPYFYMKGSTGEDNWFKRFERNTLGEPVVLVDTVFIESTMRSMEAYLRGIGYYYPEITYRVEANKRKRAKVIYHVKQNQRYFFGSYDLQIADREIYDLVKANMLQSEIHIGYGLEHTALIKEQERIINLLRNRGYYMINKDFVDFDVDTGTGNGWVRLGLNIRNPDDGSLHQKYYNNQITVEIEPNPNTNGVADKDTFPAKTFLYIPNKYELNPGILERNILLRKGRPFRQIALTRTYSRISDLGIFRFVNIQQKTFEDRDSGWVNYYIRMMPMVKYSFTLEPQVTTSDQNNTITAQGSRNYGVAFIAQFTDRNIFHNGEILQLSLRSAFEAQGQKRTSTFFNSTEQRLTASIITPKAVFLNAFDRNERFVNTRTIFSVSGIYELNTDYKRQVLTMGVTYQFNKPRISYYFTPAEFSYIKSQIIDDTLRKEAETDIFLQNLFSNNVILDTKVGFIYSNKTIAKGPSFYSIKWDVLEIAGNLLNALEKAFNGPKDEEGHYTVLGVRFFQYAKSAIDLRLNTKYDQNNASAFRLFIGGAYPYGNSSDFVPYEKRFFVGGANSLRGWRPRSLGPGSFTEPNQLDYSGEIKLEGNAEFRFNIYNRWLEGAVFADAGNVWNVKTIETEPGAEFQLNRFYKEIAFDAGLGIRLNFDIFIIRFDFGLPIHDPRYAEGQRWVINDIGGDWLYRHANFNFGIGYPF